MSMDPPDRLARSSLTRGLFFGVGLLATGLAALGAFLPVLPTTPFLILAAACFVRSSPRFHQRLLANRLVGPYLVQWDKDRTVPREAKRKAFSLVILTFSLSIYLVSHLWLRILLVSIGVALLGFLAWLPATPVAARGDESSS